MAGVTEDNREIAKKIASNFCGTPAVRKYWDEKKIFSVDLIECKDRPCEGVTSYSTIGLSDHPLIHKNVEFPVHLELTGASESSNNIFPHALTTAAFYIINEKWFCCPGAMLKNAIKLYEKSLEMQHLLFTTPFLWDDLRATKYPTKTVTWLLAVPISEDERQYARSNGTDALENLFEKEQIDIYDLSRKSLL
ncbi:MULTISPECIES: suppressor of fused domain protein [unclassified Modicisalibacter]|uniref:suppressor of fused domain protein n=1 Tax=unclassified Modicisalibacter TaxID=2679913 RepID=UPI001CCF86C6|nr:MULTISPECIES: suppressor of fused domain protein [unclassified Modicisalibacter]MBZ9558058.1 suppressor of fused domain protein [Modicisalibacter sp. R2A 31.J]MBZ9573273.1 suppressor of fused domain protein [Modicisalibacter sp. MOD 31.J]